MKRSGLVLLGVLFSLAFLSAQQSSRYQAGLNQEQWQILTTLPQVEVLQTDEAGVPAFVAGRLGYVNRPGAAGAREYLEALRPLLKAAGHEDFQAMRFQRDELGVTHFRFRQTLRGLPVVGAEMMVHQDDGTGEVVAFNGRFLPDREDLPWQPLLGGEDALEQAANQGGMEDYLLTGTPELTYLYHDNGKAYLAWSAPVAWEDADGLHIDRIFADTATGNLVAQHGILLRALNRKIYNANYSESNLPGTLMFQEGGSSSDTTAMAAYNNAGISWNYYKNRHNRDSFDGNGGTMITSVHLGSNLVNAYWTGTQTAFGDGDGSQAGPLAKALDVVAHEWTHGVTARTANLTYQNESGALNEAMSDIFAACAEAYNDGSVNTDTWKCGEDCWTPGTSGDALRYLNNPTQDGSSKDYYPERYTGTSDNGGVHWNSGIGNLMFYLLSQGGRHPRNKTTIDVPGIGMEKAEKIVYRALTVYMTSSTNFSAARTACERAATDLYTSTETLAAGKAFAAVGVGTDPGPVDPVTTLTNGQTVSSITVEAGKYKYYKIAVPANSTSLVVKTQSGTGNANLYVKNGASPTTASYDYKSEGTANAEEVSITNPAAADWYIGVYAASAVSGLSLQATYQTTTPPDVTVLQNGQAVNGVNITLQQYAYYKIAVPSGASSLTVKTLNGTGDADLYVKLGAKPTTSAADYKSEGSTNAETVTVNSPAAGEWYIGVYAYAAVSSLTVQATYVTGGGTAMNETEPNNSRTYANTVSTSGTTVTGYIGSTTDKDYFKISLPAGKTITGALTVPAGKDYELYLLNSSGVTLAKSENDAGINEQVTYKNSGTTTITVYLYVYGYNYAYSTTAPYQLKASW